MSFLPITVLHEISTESYYQNLRGYIRNVAIERTGYVLGRMRTPTPKMSVPSFPEPEVYAFTCQSRIKVEDGIKVAK